MERVFSVREVLACIRGRDGHHEMSDSGAASDPRHSSGESVEPVLARQRMDWMSKTSERKIMSKTSKATSDQTRELTADELAQIAGGTPSIPIPPPAPNVTVNGGPMGFVAPLHVARS